MSDELIVAMAIFSSHTLAKSWLVWRVGILNCSGIRSYVTVVLVLFGLLVPLFVGSYLALGKVG